MLTRSALAGNARGKLAAAEALIREGCWSDAFYLGGYAVEIALKAIVASRFRADELPDRKLVESLHTHNLARLVDIAELGADLDRRRQEPAFDRHWVVVLSWSENSRYRLVERVDAEKLVEALAHPEHGVFEWLRLHLPELGSRPGPGS